MYVWNKKSLLNISLLDVWNINSLGISFIQKPYKFSKLELKPTHVYQRMVS